MLSGLSNEETPADMTDAARRELQGKLSLFENWNVPWRIRDVFFALLGYFLSLLVGLFILGAFIGIGFSIEHLGSPPLAIFKTLFSPLGALDYWLIIQMLLTWLWISALILKPYHLRLKEFFSIPKPAGEPQPFSRARTQWANDLHHGSRAFLVSLSLVVGLLGVVLAIIWVASLQRGELPASAVDDFLKLKQRESASVLNQQLGWLRMILLVFLAPIMEELVYRGCLFAVLRKRFGFWRSSLISAVVFALVHQQYRVTLPQIALIGVSCAYVFEQTRSLRAAAIMHACWNLLGVLVVNPLITLPILAAGTGLWFWSRKSVKPSGKRTTWKWYLVVLTLTMIVGYSLDSQVAWQGIMEIPLLVAIGLYAWKQPVGSPAFWKAYGIVYPMWLLFLLWINSIPDAALLPWQRIFISSEPIRSLSDLAIEVIGDTIFMGPGIVAVWRLGFGHDLLTQPEV